MSKLTNYIIGGAIATITSVAIAESLIVVKDTIKIRRAVIKQCREDGIADKEIKEGKKTLWLESLKAAAKLRVEQIKNDPGAEIMAIWGCVTYLIGNWQGFKFGYLKGFDNAADGVGRLVEYFKDKFPDEMTSIIKKAKDENVNVALAEYIDGDTIQRVRWVADKCDLPKLKEA